MAADNAKSQGISSHGIVLVSPEYSNMATEGLINHLCVQLVEAEKMANIM